MGSVLKTGMKKEPGEFLISENTDDFCDFKPLEKGFSLPKNSLFSILSLLIFFLMQFLSHFPFKTQKSIPSGSDNRGTGLLLQAGMIRMTLA